MAFLERKLRTSRLVSKRRTTVPILELHYLAKGQHDPSWPGHWFARRVEARQLHPVCQVSYHRHARVGVGLYGPLRLTFDDRIRALPCRDYAFGSGDAVPALETQTILEMKYRVEPPAVLRQLIEEFHLEPCAVSKYRLGLEALMAADLRTGRANADLREALAGAVSAGARNA